MAELKIHEKFTYVEDKARTQFSPVDPELETGPTGSEPVSPALRGFVDASYSCRGQWEP